MTVLVVSDEKVSNKHQYQIHNVVEIEDRNAVNARNEEL